MIRIELTDNEAQALLDDLKIQIGELGMEIADTDRMEFRNRLKERRHLLQAVAGKLRNAADTEHGHGAGI